MYKEQVFNWAYEVLCSEAFLKHFNKLPLYKQLMYLKAMENQDGARKE